MALVGGKIQIRTIYHLLTKKDQRNTRKMKWIRSQYRIWGQQKRNRKNLTKNGN